MVITVARAKSNHIDFINKYIQDTSVLRHINDDISIVNSLAVIDPSCFIIIEEDNTPTGLFLTIPVNSITTDVHTCIRACTKKILAGEMGLNLLKEEGVLCVTSHIPEYNTAALKYSLRCGFQKCGFIPTSYLFNGALIGQHLVYKNLGEQLCL